MSPREILKSDSQPEDPRIIAKREKKFRAEYQPAHTEKEIKRLKETLEIIDFDFLHAKFSQIAARCGIRTEDLNFLDRDSILPVLGILGYFPEENVIGLSPAHLEVTSRGYDKKPRWSPEVDRETLALFTLKVLIHEQVHAISYTRLESWNPRLKPRAHFREGMVSRGRYERAQTGYHRWWRDGGKFEGVFIAFDEGVTEKLAHEIFMAYITERGDIADPKKVTRFLQETTLNPRYVSYSEETKLVNEIVRQIAKKSGFDEKTVWESIVRSKLEGIDLLKSNMAQFLDKHTFSGFIKTLAQLKPGEDAIRSCVQSLKKNEK